MLILRLLLAGRGKPQKWCGESWARGWQEAQHLPVPSVHSSTEVSEEPHMCPCGFSNESCPRRWQLTWEGAAEGLLLCGSQLDAVTERCFLFFFFNNEKVVQIFPRMSACSCSLQGVCFSFCIVSPHRREITVLFLRAKTRDWKQAEGERSWTGAPEAYSLGGGRARLRLPSLRPFPATSVIN